jgi:hypothetical protein
MTSATARIPPTMSRQLEIDTPSIRKKTVPPSIAQEAHLPCRFSRR